jgi:hypothetical protein
VKKSKNSNKAKFAMSDFYYLLIVLILIAAVLLPMIRLQLMILDKIKAVSDMLKRFCESEKTVGNGKSVALKSITQVSYPQFLSKSKKCSRTEINK